MNQQLWAVILLVFLISCNTPTAETQTADDSTLSDIELETKQLIAQADAFLNQPPVPITNFSSDRSAGSIHDFYSEGDYWWPDPENPDGAYIRRDGKTNPDNFTAHRKVMRDLNIWVSTLVAAYEVTGDEKYAAHAVKHLRVFFINPETLMNPNLLYAQAIKGRVTGRGIGIIDTIHLIEVAKAIQVLAESYLKEEEEVALKKWFEDYATWMNMHEYGLDEKDHGNNHSTWWAAQMAAFAELTEREDLMKVARGQFKKLLVAQMDADGTFPEEMERTKPYNYTLFNLEGYAVICQIASTPEDNLWNYETPNGTLEKAWLFMTPYMQDKSKWMKAPDVQYFDQLPIQTPGLLFAALAYDNEAFLDTWQSLSPTRRSEEVKRNFPIYQPILWLK